MINVKAFKVYGLSGSDDPGRIKYIGMTRNGLPHRLKQHVIAFRKNCHHGNLRKIKWMSDIAQAGHSIAICEVERFSTKEEALRRERELIAIGIASGQLLNLKTT